jgi:hypothetical protein
MYEPFMYCSPTDKVDTQVEPSSDTQASSTRRNDGPYFNPIASKLPYNSDPAILRTHAAAADDTADDIDAQSGCSDRLGSSNDTELHRE